MGKGSRLMLSSPLSHAVFVGAIFSVSVAFFFFGDTDTLYQENHFMENIQAAILVLAAITFFMAGKQLRDQSRYIAWFFSSLSWAFFIREIEIEGLGFPAWVEFLFAGNGRAIFAIPFFILSYFFCKHFKYYWINLIRYLLSASGIYLILAGLSMTAGWPIDKKIINYDGVVFWEECFELVGYYFMLVAAIYAPVSFHAVEEADRRCWQVNL